VKRVSEAVSSKLGLLVDDAIGRYV